jgi:hypothetical protein
MEHFLEQLGAVWSRMEHFLEQLGAVMEHLEQLGAVWSTWSSYGALGAALEHFHSRRTCSAELLSMWCSYFCCCWGRLLRCPSAVVPPLGLVVRFQPSSEFFSFTMVFTAMYSTKSKFYANYCWSRLILTCNCSLMYFLLCYYKFGRKLTRNLTKNEFNEATVKITS